MNLIRVFPRQFKVRKHKETRTSHRIKSHDIYTIQVMFGLFKCLIENIFQSNQSYLLPILFLTWTPQQRHKENPSKKKVSPLRCSESFRVDFYYCYEIISFIYVTDIC